LKRKSEKVNMGKLNTFITTHKMGFGGSIIAILVVVIIGLSFWSNYQIGQLRKDVAFFQNEAAKRDEIHQIDSTTISRLSLKVRDISSNNNDLQNRIKLLNGTIRSQASFIATLADSIANINTHGDTLITGGLVRRFDVTKNAFTLKGWFELQEPYSITFEQLAAQIALELNMVQLPSGQWEAFVDTKNPSLHVTDLITKVNPYRPPWWKKFNLSAGIYLQGNEFGLVGGVGYDKFIGLIGYDPRGYLLGVQYVF